MDKLSIPCLSLVLLVGPSGSGKSTFARRHFKPTQVLSSDFFRGMVADDENAQAATPQAFAALHFVAEQRLAAGRLTVIDATNVKREDRQTLLQLARKNHVLTAAIVFDLPERVCHERNRARADRSFGPHVVNNQMRELRRSLRHLREEGFHFVYRLESVEQVDAVAIELVPLWTDRREQLGPFDIIGDVHGCRAELDALLERLGYPPEGAHPQGRKAVFVGDLVDRGPDTPGVLRRVMSMVQAGRALCVPGNHDVKLLKKLRGREVKITHGLAESLEQLAREPQPFIDEVIRFLDSLVSHYVLDGGRLVVAHAGLKQSLQGRASSRVRDFALYGDTTGETDEYGLPVRHAWSAEYRGQAMVVYGHTPTLEAEWINNTICIDTGCVFGGKLTALRYPERELLSVPAERMYYAPSKPLAPPRPTRPDDVLDLDDVSGKRILQPRLLRSVKIEAENSAAALEVMSRFAEDPRWLVYLPPTMAPCSTGLRPEPRQGPEAPGPPNLGTELQTEAVATHSNSGSPEGQRPFGGGLGAEPPPDPSYLEHPLYAFEDLRREGVVQAICEEKHMGSRAVVILCKPGAAERAFRRKDGGRGVILTRTGRAFFSDRTLEQELLGRLESAVDRVGLWSELSTDWLLLDTELLPWSAKAQELVRTQYAAVGAAGSVALREATKLLARAAGRELPGLETLSEHYRAREEALEGYRQAYGRYCWPIRSIDDYKIAPFHLLASEGHAHFDRPHPWHLGVADRLAEAEPRLVLSTRRKRVDLTDAASVADATSWWLELTGGGVEGMVIKPLDFISQTKAGIGQPAIKCRGREYLRIIYGPEYSLPENLARLRARSLGHKRALALREFALGVEAVERFVAREPLYKIHECVFGVLALESEPIDPRL